jgi:hypothetical protein
MKGTSTLDRTIHSWRATNTLRETIHSWRATHTLGRTINPWRFMVLHEWIVLLNVFVVFYIVPAFRLYLYMVSIYIVHEKHYKFSSQKVTIATDRSRKSCVFFNIVDWFIHSRQNNKLLSDDIFPLYCETCNLTSEKSKVRIAKHTTRLQWLQLNNLFQLSWIWIGCSCFLHQ